MSRFDKQKKPKPVPVPPGGVLLNRPQAIPTTPPPRTETTVHFKSCIAGMHAVLDEDNVCRHYQLVIQDPIFMTRYELDFTQEMREQWETDLGSMPLVGEHVENPDVG